MDKKATKKSSARKKRLRRIFFLGFGSIVIICTMTITLGHYWIEIVDKYKERDELEDKLAQLKEKEQELRLEADKLQDPDYVARYAREKYLYSKDGEFIIKIPEEK